MKRYIYITSLLLAVGMISADDHKGEGKKMEKAKNHPNFFMDGTLIK